MFAASKTASLSGYQIQRSLRFNSADSAYLNRTPASAGNRKTWTWSAWVKRGSLGGYQVLFSGGEIGSYNYSQISFDTSNVLAFDVLNSGPTVVGRKFTNAIFRDVSAWYHIVMIWDTTNATASDRMQLYVNNVRQTSFSLSTDPALNADGWINTANAHGLGRFVGNSSDYFNGYMTEVNFIDGQALTPSSFGQTNANTGVWEPKPYAGTYGTNGFYLNFSDNSNTTATTLGKDYSGNGNNWTPNNFSVSAGAGNDSLVDVPTPWGTDTGVGGTVRGNYATLNPLNAGNASLLNNGNLAISNPSDANWRTGVSTVATSSGKWYAEVTVGANDLIIGIDKASVVFSNTNTMVGGSSSGWGYFKTGQIYNNSNVITATGGNYAFVSGDVIGIAFDADAGTLKWYKNNSEVPYTVTGLTDGPYVLGFSAYSPGVGNINFGQRPFAYTAPSGFKALCTQNLPTPTIGATASTQAGKFFNAVTYTGNGSTQSITGVGFQPDLVWVKSRSAATNHALIDVLRGVSRWLGSNDTGAEYYSAGDFVTAFNSDGFSVGPLGGVNTSSATYVGWNWKANGAGVTNTAGSITSTVSANTTSGFSVVTYTGNGVGGSTIGHGLGSAPKMIIVKRRNNTGDWWVWRSDLAALNANNTLRLNLTDAVTASFGVFGSTTSSVFTAGSGGDINANTATYVAYCFAEVPGFSKFGSYTGNGSTDGPFVYCGFKPRWLLIKSSTDATSGEWILIDTVRSTYNANGDLLKANKSDAEASYTNYIDILSNGFKLRNNISGSWTNVSGATYIFAAFAEAPQKFALAR